MCNSIRAISILITAIAVLRRPTMAQNSVEGTAGANNHMMVRGRISLCFFLVLFIAIGPRLNAAAMRQSTMSAEEEKWIECDNDDDCISIDVNCGCRQAANKQSQSEHDKIVAAVGAYCGKPACGGDQPPHCINKRCSPNYLLRFREASKRGPTSSSYCNT